MVKDLPLVEELAQVKFQSCMFKLLCIIESENHCYLCSVFGGGKFDTQTVAGRQQAINTAYDKLVQDAEVSFNICLYIPLVFRHCVYMLVH